MNNPPPSTGAMPNGQPAGKPIPVMKRQAKSNPLFSSKKKPVFKSTTGPRAIANGVPKGLVKAPIGRSPAALNAPSPGQTQQAPKNPHAISGFSDPALAGPAQYHDFKLFTTKKDLLAGLRHHVLQLSGDSKIDIRKDTAFPRPVRLHRKDSKAAGSEQPVVEPETNEPLATEETAELDKRKEARRLEREANLAQVAPSAETGKKSMQIKKKTAQVFNKDYTVEERRAMQNNYEEKLPWHLEDFDNQHCFIGSNQTGATNLHAAFVYESTQACPEGRFRMLPIEKMYQFKERKTFRTLTIDEAEKAMKKRGQDPKWVVERREANMKEAQLERAVRGSRAFFGTKDEAAAGRTGEGADLDFDAEEDFADDEEGDTFLGKDEDEQMAEKRIKEDRLNANFFDNKDEEEYDRAEAEERREKEKKKSAGKKMRKVLEKRERNYDHASDSDADPYASSSETDSEAERQRLEAEKKLKAETDLKSRSGLSTGSNTPSSRREKRANAASDREGGMKKSSSSRSLKRPGSPNLSEASGTDASLARKKEQTSNQTLQPARSTNQPPSSSAPTTTTGISSKKRKSIAGSALSDTDALALDTGLSDASRAKRLKSGSGRSQLRGAGLSPTLKATGSTTNKSSRPSPSPTSRTGTPLAGRSRAASPKAGGGAGNRSPRAASPTSPPATDTDVPAVPALPYPTSAEIIAAIPTDGIGTTALGGIIRKKYPAVDKKELAALVKANSRMDKKRNLVFPRGT